MSTAYSGSIFAMAFHCYQPAFNFEWETERVYRTAYAPLLEAFTRYPGIKATFHFSGNLLEWFESRHPEYIDTINALLRAGQIELIGGAFSDPVMSIIPERDRKGQIELNSDVMERMFGIRPKGMWLAERVWFPGVVDTLCSGGAEYTIIDDHHLRSVGVDGCDVLGPFVVGGEKSTLKVFPAMTYLRYSMPFMSPGKTLEYMKEKRKESGGKDVCFFFADDGEKFGAWPYTYDLVHKKGWFDRMFREIEENSSWITPMTYSEVAEIVRPSEIENIPECSYAEMMEWSGGRFNNFLDKYPEVGRMHKRMVEVSRTVGDMDHAAADGGVSARPARKELFKSQSNCAYWHGVFGGVYLPHLREGVYRHLIKAEKEVDSVRSGMEDAALYDTCCGDEAVMENSHLKVFVNAADGGAVSEIDHKISEINLVNVISRVPERYHGKLCAGYSLKRKRAREKARSGEIPDVHDMLGVGERGLRRYLQYDGYKRSSFLTRIEVDPGSPSRGIGGDVSFLRGGYDRVDTRENGVLSCDMTREEVLVSRKRGYVPLRVRKNVTLDKGPAVMMSQEVTDLSDSAGHIGVAAEFNFLVWDRDIMRRPRRMPTDHITLTDKYSGLNVDFFMDRKYNVYATPVFTVNETEAGLRKMFQGISVLIGEEIASPGGGFTSGIKITVAIG